MPKYSGFNLHVPRKDEHSPQPDQEEKEVNRLLPRNCPLTSGSSELVENFPKRKLAKLNPEHSESETNQTLGERKR